MATNRSIRIQLAMISLICFFTLPWLFTDLGSLTPQLALANQREWKPVTWRMIGSSRRTLRISAELTPSLDLTRDWVLSLVVEPVGGEPITMAGTRMDDAEVRGRTLIRFYGTLPNSSGRQSLDSARLRLAVRPPRAGESDADPPALFAIAGRLQAHDGTVAISDPLPPAVRAGP